MSNDADLLAEFPVILTLPVQWGDQDAMQHVNNVVYFRWCESARIEYFGRIGLADRRTAEHVGPILASIKCDFRRQLNFPDTIRIGARIVRIGRTSLTMTHRVESQAQRAIVAEAESTMVVFDYDSGKPHPVPDAMRTAIESLEGRTFAQGQ
ncbi:MAG TPA: thioesterase family protein [Pirellulales bacterium]|nr:thioesterase family protein [Pirellulales bacterium]